MARVSFVRANPVKAKIADAETAKVHTMGVAGGWAGKLRRVIPCPAA